MASRFDGLEVPFVEAPHELANIWVAFGPESRVLQKGWIKAEGKRALPISLLWDKDVQIRLRDGVILYGDVFRPADCIERLPAILPWSPYGKTGTGTCSLCRSSLFILLRKQI